MEKRRNFYRIGESTWTRLTTPMSNTDTSCSSSSSPCSSPSSPTSGSAGQSTSLAACFAALSSSFLTSVVDLWVHWSSSTTNLDGRQWRRCWCRRPEVNRNLPEFSKKNILTYRFGCFGVDGILAFSVWEEWRSRALTPTRS